MMVILERRSCRPMREMSQLSMTMAPAAGSMIRNRASIRDDLPAPVLPTIPTCECVSSLSNQTHDNITRLIICAFIYYMDVHNICMYVHMHTHICMHTHAHTHSCTHTGMQHAHMHTHRHTHTHLGTSGYISYDIPDHEVQAFTVAGGVMVKCDITLSGPPLGGSMVLNDWRGLHNRLGVVYNTLLLI